MSPTPARTPRTQSAAVLIWLAVKIAVFVLLGRMDIARFVYSGF
jgi:hypothetical protein